jgi:nitroreductase
MDDAGQGGAIPPRGRRRAFRRILDAAARPPRRFDPTRRVGRRTLARLLRLATRMPSGHNLQPWRFVVIRSERGRSRLRACAFGQSIVGEASAAVLVLAQRDAHATDRDAVLDERVRLGDLDPASRPEAEALARRATSRWPSPELWAARSAMLATGALVLAAAAEGLGALLVEDFDHGRLRRAFGIPLDHVVCAIVALGHPAEPGRFAGRLGLDRVAYREHFGQPWRVTRPDDRPPGEPPGGALG